MDHGVDLVLDDLDATRRLGRALARAFGAAGCVVVLEGPLGAGKTSLAKAFVSEATGIPEDDVTSPTFVLANDYPGKPGVLHLDAYRLGSDADLETLGFGALEATGRAVLLEWGSRVPGALPRERLDVELAHADPGRRARLTAHGERARAALARLPQEIQRMKLRLALSGAKGRMGRHVIAAAGEADSGFTLAQALGREGSEGTGSLEVAPGVRLEAALRPGADVVVDFSTPAGLAARVAEAAALGVPFVGCATGLGPKEEAALDQATARIPVLHAANTSLGVTLLSRLVREAARALGPDYDVEIVELHHKHKLDAPSGTALLLARALEGDRKQVHGRSGKGGRSPGEVGVHALRLGDVVGEHRVYLAGPGERIELAHVATSRETFARGALRAARWLVGRPPGRYRMSDVLGLET